MTPGGSLTRKMPLNVGLIDTFFHADDRYDLQHQQRGARTDVPRLGKQYRRSVLQIKVCLHVSCALFTALLFSIVPMVTAQIMCRG